MPDYWQFSNRLYGARTAAGDLSSPHHEVLRIAGCRSERPEGLVFVGDGEMDEPESLGAISLAGRERLDNLIFVVNCNLQRLDGPVRGNGKIIQNLKAFSEGPAGTLLKSSGADSGIRYSSVTKVVCSTANG